MLLDLLHKTLAEARREHAPAFLGHERRYLDGLEVQGLEKGTLTLESRVRAPGDECRDRAVRTLGRCFAKALGVEVRVRVVAAPTPVDDPDLCDPIVDDGNSTASLLLGNWREGQPSLPNLVFLYGPAGCGKTHLVNWFLRRSEVPASTWTALELQAAITGAMRAGDFLAFKRSLLETRLLIVDEVHRLSGKWRTQEELILLLDEWRALGTRLLFVGRHHPRDILDLGGSLGSRFLGGFTIDVRPPGVAARVELLRRHGYTEERARRELPGAFVDGRTYADVLRLVERHRSGRRDDGTSPCPIEACLGRVARAFGVAVEELGRGGSSRRISVPRQVSAYILVRRGASLVSLARRLGWRSASSVSYAVQRIRERMAVDRDFQELVEGLERR
ncbi:MAG: DnaA/Hda family protein [Planctomycetota bacterium]